MIFRLKPAGRARAPRGGSPVSAHISERPGAGRARISRNARPDSSERSLSARPQPAEAKAPISANFRAYGGTLPGRGEPWPAPERAEQPSRAYLGTPREAPGRGGRHERRDCAHTEERAAPSARRDPYRPEGPRSHPRKEGRACRVDKPVDSTTCRRISGNASHAYSGTLSPVVHAYSGTPYAYFGTLYAYVGTPPDRKTLVPRGARRFFFAYVVRYLILINLFIKCLIVGASNLWTARCPQIGPPLRRCFEKAENPSRQAGRKANAASRKSGVPIYA